VQWRSRLAAAERPGEVLIQTEYPEHPLLTQLITGGYEAFAAAALEERKARALAAVRADRGAGAPRRPRRETPLAFLDLAREQAAALAGAEVEISDRPPHP